VVWLVRSTLNFVRIHLICLIVLHWWFTDGRRPSYLWCLPVMILGSFGVARARTVNQLMFWRIIQGMGASPSLSIGAGVIGDIYRLEERGSALGTYFGVCSVSCALSPTQIELDLSSRLGTRPDCWRDYSSLLVMASRPLHPCYFRIWCFFLHFIPLSWDEPSWNQRSW